MRAISRILYLACFVGMALVAALALDGAVRPSIAAILTRAVLVAAACAAPGLIHRRLWPLSLVLVPVGCYLLLRTTMPVPALVEGVGGQYRFYTEQLWQGALLYKSETFPLALTDSPQLTLLLAFTVYWLTGVAAFVSVSLRKPVPGVVLILVLLGFGLTVDRSPRALWTAVLFLVFAGCLLVLSRGIRRSGWRLRDALAGGVVAVVASLLAVLLLVTTPSVVARPWQDWQTWTFGMNRSNYTFNWTQNFPELLDPANNRVVMKVQSSSPSYWRANALDSFTGSAWVTSQAFLVRLTSERSGDTRVYSIPPATPTPAGKTVTEIFSIQSVSTNYLFAGGDPRALTIGQNIPLRMNDMRSLRVSQALGPSLSYSLTAVIPELVPAALVGLGAHYPKAVEGYLTLPFSRIADIAGPDKEAAWRDTVAENTPGGSEWLELYALNQRIIGSATDPYDVTLRIERYLRQFYEYSLAPPPSDYSSPFAAFLFDTRAGYCQHFAGAMALLLRYNSVPSRVAVGFATGEEESPGVYLVSSNNAHAWVEAYFPTIGWVAFDPTPGRSLPAAGASSTSPSFINPFTDALPSGPGTVVTEPPRSNRPEDGQSGGQTPAEQNGGWLSRATWVPWIAGLIILVAGWPVARGLWRRRRLHRGPWDQRLRASIALLREDLAGFGAPVGPGLTFEEVLQKVEAHIGLQRDSALADRADAVLFGGRRARPEDLEQAESLRREVKSRLRRRHGWLRTAFAWYGVRRHGVS